MVAKRQSTERAELPAVACAHVECTRPATLRVRRPTGWANLCSFHDIEHVTEDAKDWLADEGMLRRPDESMRDWMRRTLDWLRERREQRPQLSGMRRAGEILVSNRATEPEPGCNTEAIACASSA